MIDCPVNVDQKSVKANMKFLKHVEFNLIVDVSGCGVLRRRKSPRFSKIRGDRVHTLLQLPSRFLDFISQPCIVMAARSQIRMSALHMLSKSSSSNIIDACAVSIRTVNYIVMLLISSLKWVWIHTTSTPEPWGLYLNQSKSSSRSDFCDQRLPFTTLKIAGGEDYHRFSLSLICRIRVSLQPARRPIFS